MKYAYTYKDKAENYKYIQNYELYNYIQPIEQKMKCTYEGKNTKAFPNL